MSTIKCYIKIIYLNILFIENIWPIYKTFYMNIIIFTTGKLNSYYKTHIFIFIFSQLFCKYKNPIKFNYFVISLCLIFYTH